MDDLEMANRRTKNKKDSQDRDIDYLKFMYVLAGAGKRDWVMFSE